MSLTGVALPRSAADRRVLVFSKTAGYRHDSIPDGIADYPECDESRPRELVPRPAR
jgi:hypothetical protein